MPNIQIGSQVIAFPDDLPPDQLKAAAQKAYAQFGNGPDRAQLEAEDKPVQPASVISDIAKGAKQGLEGAGAGIGSLDLNQASQVAQGGDATTTGGKIGKFVGGMVSPQALAMGGGIKAVAAPFMPAISDALGKAADVAFAPSKATAGAAMNAAENGAGVVLRAPVTSEIAESIGLPKAAKFSQVTNAIKEKLTAGESLPLQTVKDFLAAGDNVLSKPVGSTTKAAVSQAMALGRKFMNDQIPERAPAAADFANAALRTQALKTGGAVVGAGSTLLYALKKLGVLGK